MTAPRFHVMNDATGLYAARIPAAEPFTQHRKLAASYGLGDAIRHAEELRGGNPAGFRLIAAEFFAEFLH